MDYSFIKPRSGFVIIRELPPVQAKGLVMSADTLAERRGIGEVVAVYESCTSLTPGDVVLYNDLASNDIAKQRGLIEEPLYAVHADRIFAVLAPPTGIPTGSVPLADATVEAK